MISPNRLECSAAQLLVIDVQQRMLPHVAGCDAVLAQCQRALRAAAVLGLPATLTEHYPAGLGHTDPRIVEVAGAAQRLDKPGLHFSVWREEPIRARLESARRPQVLIVGIEAHVCIQQTVLDLRSAQLHPFVLADAIGSRRTGDRDVAIERMRAAGAVVTTVESAIYELMEQAGTDLFRQMLPIVRQV
jgi:nicotinamidase-related amidase